MSKLQEYLDTMVNEGWLDEEDEWEDEEDKYPVGDNKFLNLLTTPEEMLKEAFNKVEGNPNTFDNSLYQKEEESLKAVVGAFERKVDEGTIKDHPVSSNIGPTVCGNWRWFVYIDGTIRLSEYHASEEARKIAKELGFKVS